MTTGRLTVLALVTLVTSNSLHAQNSPPEFTPRNGFSGPSEGNGSLRLLLGRPRSFHVESYGVERPDGAFQLDQTITLGRGRPLNRTWVIATVGPDRYAATLTDAAGAISGYTDGNHLFLRYRYKGPFVAHQTLELMPDGRTIDNVGRLTLLGVPVGRLHETIVRKN